MLRNLLTSLLLSSARNVWSPPGEVLLHGVLVEGRDVPGRVCGRVSGWAWLRGKGMEGVLGEGLVVMSGRVRPLLDRTTDVVGFEADRPGLGLGSAFGVRSAGCLVRLVGDRPLDLWRVLERVTWFS